MSDTVPEIPPEPEHDDYDTDIPGVEFLEPNFEAEETEEEEQQA